MPISPLDQKAVFAFLEKQKKSVLLDYLQRAFAEMNGRQQRYVFGSTVGKPSTSGKNATQLRKEIEEFCRDSLANKYYAPFDIDSKNFTHVPEETQEWCDRFALLVTDAAKLTANGKHAEAVACFAALYELLERLGDGDGIIFADEVGSWMIPTDEKLWIRAYLTSLAATTSAEEFAAIVSPIMRMDSGQSFASQVYISACAVANPQQKAQLQADTKRQNIRTESACMTRSTMRTVRGGEGAGDI